MNMKKIISLGILIFIFCLSVTVQAQENEKICSQRNDFCFQIPPNHFMLTTNDIESASVSYKTVDGSSTIEIVNGNLSDGCDMHKLYLMTLSQWTTNNYRLTLKKEYADLLRQADAIFIEELYRHDLYNKVSQAFAVFLPVKSVGVMGDGRRYDYVIAIRAVETIDFMTARWAHLPYEFLDLISRRIINEVPGISRVAYDISGKPPATIEWE